MPRQRPLSRSDSRNPVRRGAHGLTADEIDWLKARQGGRCAICLKPGRLQLDHDHRHCPGKTGCRACIRGALCPRCNGALGKLEATGHTDRLVTYLGGRPR